MGYKYIANNDEECDIVWGKEPTMTIEMAISWIYNLDKL
jgi:hypothetical protein